jgi:capsular exopolysaccharide synthesis family protein
MESKTNYGSILDSINFYSILRDVARSLWAIALGAIAVAMIANLFAHRKMESTYSTKATFVITSRTSGNYAYNNLNAAATMAESSTNVLNSSLLRRKVCEDLGVSSFNATMSANAIKDTNLMTLKVTSDAPWNTYRITRSVMRNMEELTNHISSDMVMEVLQDPAVPTRPDAAVSPRKQMIKYGAIAGLALTALFVYLSYKKDTIKSEEDLEEKLDAKSLGELYTYGKRSIFRSKKKKNKLLITELTAGFEFTERFKKLAARIASEADKNNAKVIIVTSVREHEGKSTVASNTALALARKTDRVLLIDGDMRRPTLASLFLEPGEKPEYSLSDVLDGAVILEEAIFRDEKRDLDLLLSAHGSPNSTDLVSSEEMQRLIEDVRPDYDYVIIDTPPMSLMADAEVLANIADLSVLTVKYDLVSARDINDAIDSLRGCRAEFAGCVLNEIKSLPGERVAVIGYGGYGRYGKYGKYGRYGKYGKYGKYGNYGNYGNYGAYGRYGHYGAYGYYGHYGDEQREEPEKPAEK